MALNIITGFTDDGLIFVKLEGTGPGRSSKKAQTTITMEPDQAEWLSKQLKSACEQCVSKAKSRIIQPDGEPIIIKR